MEAQQAGHDQNSLDPTKLEAHGPKVDESNARSILERDERYLIPVYARYAVVMDRGEGCLLFDTDGNQYLDMMAGLGVNALGHAHPRMVAAMAEQAGRMVHLSPQFSNPYPSALAERLCSLAGMAGAFFSTGGSEAVEGALKLARTHGRQHGGAAKHGLVALRRSYHGRTFGSLAVTGQDRYSLDFGPSLPGVRFVDRDDLAQLRAAVNETTCAILIEPLMGEGGVLACSRAFLAEARRLADQWGALLIFDEIQSGLGRTGDWFAFERTGVRPDVLILGKPLGGGIPLSALLVDEALFHTFGLAKHGSTLGGSPMACRLGLEFLAIMEEEQVLSNVRHAGAALGRGLRRLAAEFDEIVEVRGQGLMWGVEMSVPARPLAEEGLRRGVMFNVVQGNVLRFLPPLVVTEAQVERALAVLEDVLEAHLGRRFAVPETAHVA